MQLLEIFLILRFHIILWVVDVSLLLCLAEEGREKEDGDGCCAPDFKEFVCRRALTFAMGPSRSFGSHDEARISGKTGNVSSFCLVCTSGL